MIPSAFEYYAPTTVDEAIALLEQHAPDVKALAGGQSLIPRFCRKFSAAALSGMLLCRNDRGEAP